MMRIAIVNDSMVAVAAMSRVLTAAGQHQIAWVAHNGLEAIERCAADPPSLILMDLFMPELDGVEATRRIMARTPCPILIVTASVGTRAGKVFEALGAGAMDAVSTPILGSDGAAGGAAALLSKIRALSWIIGTGDNRVKSSLERASNVPPGEPLVVIGASAGGPAALATILAALPRNFPAGIIIVQHIDREFAPLLAKWLAELSGMLVTVARDGDQPRPGTALIAGTNDHLVFKSCRSVGYTPEPRAHAYHPSVDVFFSSALHHWQGKLVGILLTGMGRDGAIGLKSLRDAGHHTIAQDRASCTVYGMPKKAAEVGAAVEILPLEEIAPTLRRVFA